MSAKKAYNLIHQSKKSNLIECGKWSVKALDLDFNEELFQLVAISCIEALSLDDRLCILISNLVLY